MRNVVGAPQRQSVGNPLTVMFGHFPTIREIEEYIIDEAMKLAHRLAEGPTRALTATRALLEESEHASYAAQFRREIEVQADIRRSEDALEGRNAFVEKRAARFSGR